MIKNNKKKQQLRSELENKRRIRNKTIAHHRFKTLFYNILFFYLLLNLNLELKMMMNRISIISIKRYKQKTSE